MRSIWAIFLFIPAIFGSYCGRNGVPFSLEVLPNGAPVLGCSQPSCIAQPEDGVDDSIFATDGTGQVDGFFRDGDRAQNTLLIANKFRANCSKGFDQMACVRKNQWVGGIEYIDHPRQPLILQCCSFEGLKFSQDVGVTTISAGEAVTGGEVVRDGRQISFDVIANVRKVVDSDETVSYEVTVRRMNCLPDPPEVEVQYEQDIEEEILRVLGSAGKMTLKKDHSGSKERNFNEFRNEKSITSTEQIIEKRAFFKPAIKSRKKPSNEFAFAAPNFNPLESPMETKKPKMMRQDYYEPMRVQPHQRTVPPWRPAQRASTTANPRPTTTTTTTTTTTPTPVTTSVFTPVTIGSDQFMRLGAPVVTPAPLGQMGFAFPAQTLPTLPTMSPFFNPFTLPPHQQFGLVTPAPNPFVFPQHPFFNHQLAGLNPAQQFGAMNPGGFGHAQLSPLANQGQVVSIASPSYAPLSSLQFGQPFNPFAHSSQSLWPFGQSQGFSMMGAPPSNQPQPVNQINQNDANRFRVNLGEVTEFVAPKLAANGQIANVNQYQPAQTQPNLFTPSPFPQGQLGQTLQNQNFNLGK